MGRLDKAYVYNAGQRDHTKPQIVHYKGERRRQLWPAGTVERFVNLQGSVVQCVLVPPGVPPSKESVATARAKLHSHKTTDGDVVGFIEHAKCPLKTGIADLDPVLGDECEAVRNAVGPACKEHPVTVQVTRERPTKPGKPGKVKSVEYFDGCPHVQWMIEERRKVYKAKVEARMKRQATLQEIEQAKLAAAQSQAEATTKILERVAEKLDALPARPRKAAQEPNE
jgi:hypothetical protein